jgi:hypothetical protein
MHLSLYESVGTIAVGTQRERERHAHSVQQATEADWLTRARDFKCTEPSKIRLTRARDSRCAEPSRIRPLSYVPVTSTILIQ